MNLLFMYAEKENMYDEHYSISMPNTSFQLGDTNDVMSPTYQRPHSVIVKLTTYFCILNSKCK